MLGNEYGVFSALHKLLGLPNHIINLEISFVAIRETLVVCTYELQENDSPKVVDDKIITETKKYKIVRKFELSCWNNMVYFNQ